MEGEKGGGNDQVNETKCGNWGLVKDVQGILDYFLPPFCASKTRSRLKL